MSGSRLLLILLILLVHVTLSPAQWIQTNGPYGGMIRAIATSGTNLYAGTDGSGVFLSTNNGASWTPSSAGLTNNVVQAFARIGTNLFAGTSGGVFLSVNNGASWHSVSNGLGNSVVTALAVSGTNLFAGTYGSGVFLSTDNGASWTPASTGLTNINALAFSGTNLLAGTAGSGAFLSTNNGASWTPVTIGSTNANVDAFAVSGTNVYAGTDGGVFVSTNNGTSWNPASTGFTSVYALAVIGTNLFAGTSGGGVFLSTNGGAGWNPVSLGSTSANVYAFTVSGTNLFAGTDGSGVFLSSNYGVSWTPVNTGLTSSVVTALAVSGTNLFAGAWGAGVLLSTDGGASWTQVNNGLTNTEPNALVISGTNLFAGTYGSGVFRSTNSGANWTQVNNGLTNTFVSSLYMSGTNLFAGTDGDGGVFLSTNNGASWNPVGVGSTSASVYALAVSGANLFAGTAGGGVFLSTNNGASWNPASAGLTNNNVFALAVSGANLFAGTYGGGVFISTNSGANWNPVSTGLSNSDVYGLAVSGTNLFAETIGGGVFLSTNNGASWNPVNTGLANTSVYSLAVSGTNLFSGTKGSGVWRRPLADIFPPLPAPVANTATSVTTTSFTANWGAVSGATSYQLDVATDAGFTAFVAGYNSLSVPGTSQAVSGLVAGTTYYYRVRAVNAGVPSSNSNTITVSTLTIAPALSVATGVTSSGFTANWGGVAGAASYQMDVATDAGFTGYVAGFNNLAVGGITQTVTGLSANTTYYYRVRGVNASGASASSGTGTQLTAPPAPVANAATNVTTNSFTANWSATAGATGYFLDVATDPAFLSGFVLNNQSEGTTTSASVSGLTAGTTYYYRIRAANTGGTSSSSGSISVPTLPPGPGVPAAAAATSVTSTGFTANWGAVSGATSYQLDVATNAGFTAFVAGYNNLSVADTSQAVSGLVAGTTYYYRVRAVNAGVPSSNSNTITVSTLTIPPALSAATGVTSSGFTANWGGVAGAASYQMDVATDAGFTGYVAGFNNLPVGGITQTVTGLSANTTYYYRVRGVNASGASASSGTGTQLTAPPAPIVNAPPVVTATSFTANWSASTGATGYFLDVATDPAFLSGFVLNNQSEGTATSASVSGLTANTTYYYRIRAANTGGTSSSSSFNSVTTHQFVPGAPSAAAATSVTSTGFTANWGAVSGATSYQLDVATDSGFTAPVAGYNNLSVSDTSQAVSGLVAGTTYYYRVRAVDAGVPGSNSNTIAVSTLTIAPTLSVATGVTSSGFTANWGAVTGAASYQLDVAADVGFTAPVPGFNNLAVGGITQTVTGLSANMTYYYRVRGVNASGASASSGIGTQLTAPPPPVANAATSVTTTSFTANWSASAGATGYKLDVATDTGFTSYVSGYRLKDVGNVVSSPVTGLTFGMAYHYRVWAYNSGGTSSRSNRVDTTTSSLPPPPPVAGAATYLTSNSFSANWSASVGASGYQLDVATDSLFTAILPGYVSRDVGNLTVWTIGGLTGNRTYYYRLWAYNSAGRSGASSKTISVTTPVIVLSNTQSYTTRNLLTDYSSAEYHLVGIPGNSGLDISAFLSGQWRKDWEVYSDNGKHGAPKDYYDEYQSGSGTFVCSTGKAFWVLNRGNWTLGSSVNTASYDTSHVATIPLTNGDSAWQLITNPFTVSIPWASITAFNGSLDSISTWNGSTLAYSSLFEPYKGYQLFNGSGKSSIRIPYSLTVAKGTAKLLAEQGAWHIQVVARSGKYSDETTSLGISGGAENIYQQHKPRMLALLPEVYFDRPDLDAQFNEFATDIRPQITDLGTWDMKVRSDQMQAVQLEFVSVNTVPENLALALIDGAGARSIDLRKQATYVLEPASVITVLQVAIGRPDLVKKLTDAVGPREYALLQNYPNPFNPTTTIPMLIPGQSRVSLKVYNILGQLVTTLYEGDVMPGKYYVTWDGTDSSKRQVSTGIYICRMIANGSIRKTVKLNMIK